MALKTQERPDSPRRVASELQRRKAPATPGLTLKDIQEMDPNTAAVRFLMERALAEEEQKTQGERFKNVEAQVRWEGNEITLPDSPARMNFIEAKEWLERLEKADQENIAVNEIVEAFPFDGAIAMMKALKQVYGWANPVPPQSFFEAPPTMMSVDISPTERTQIIWGRFSIPGIEGTLMTGLAFKNGRPVFTINGTVRKKYVVAIAEIAELTRQIVAEESIYRGKPVKLNVDANGNPNFAEPPSFLDVTQANQAELVFSDDLMEQINTNLFTPIINSDICRQNFIPLKRGILMEGPYGTGKTLCAFVTARIAEESGWTFIMIDNVTALTAALNFGALYQPCVIFAEDIDRETAGERTPALDAILNVIDGIGAKGKEIMVVLTSNHAENINRAMLRPGRLDAVLSIQPPDAQAAEKLMRLYGRGLIAANESLERASQELCGQIPAVIRECVERAKLHAISRNSDVAIELREDDIISAARGMKHHLDLLRGRPDVAFSVEHQLGAALIEAVNKGLGVTEGELVETHDLVSKIAAAVGA
jgi:transitional endoplasmic reticulum ATPase